MNTASHWNKFKQEFYIYIYKQKENWAAEMKDEKKKNASLF